MKNNTGLLISLVLGAAAGAAIALFFTSEEGQEVVEELKDAANKAGKRVREAVDTVEEQVSEGREMVESLQKQSGKFLKKFTS